MSPFFSLSLQLIVIAYALVGGVFLAFSDFIMRALAQTGGHAGVEAMQAVNRAVFRWVFMTLFIGLAPVSLAVAASGFIVGGGPGVMLTLAGLIYAIGCFGVTVVVNVPMNETLARMDAASDTARAYWTEVYLPRWTLWNSVRTVACAAASGLLLLGLLWLAETQAA
ncbi:membrane protein [Jannaschia pagri]|uniref:Membrane protein n=1 Tax=Jannaschia pagri TaxID=2829797 RepID=A0ABQ4NRP0_9RHOB|nr:MULTISPECIES: anthrone oxygenase family protein [unclassified Jannaschia]GIT93260.1 membrane protein [Jannaschia sp. AI_61]GIT97073.1 membrane protein [Jannaschia sp. AI_62]